MCIYKIKKHEQIYSQLKIKTRPKFPSIEHQALALAPPLNLALE